MVSVSRPGNTEDYRARDFGLQTCRYFRRPLSCPAQPGPRRVSFHLAPFVHGTATAWSDCGGDVRRDVSESADVAVVGDRKL